ncbi:MAG: class I SAM-dependent methyltransferase [Timaviella obliquedivisa GSE-PSE-MK23-08B]|jgi:predicted O-methyltransferase YrrM|nr:class I SAM-dependent methyltransferase [Timaviella obliquedivisa GSE-PSE-MK23-08B]
MKTDPFSIKKYSKFHPKRLGFTIQARFLEKEAQWNFEKYKLSEKFLSALPSIPDLNYSDTAVTPIQAQYLLAALAATEHLTDTVVVEVGSCRGVTTQLLAQSTQRQVIAVDPYIGYGGFEEDLLFFKARTTDLKNVIHERTVSGSAAMAWQYPPISMIFIDALHDYVNTAFDIAAWYPLLVKGAILACHDTDQQCFAGTRKAVFEFSQSTQIFAHLSNLTLFTI